MAVCDTCGNDYDKAFTVNWNGRTATFDSIECRILGHGIETEEAIYCCAHCARKAGNADINDRFPTPAGA